MTVEVTEAMRIRVEDNEVSNVRPSAVFPDHVTGCVVEDNEIVDEDAIRASSTGDKG